MDFKIASLHWFKLHNNFAELCGGVALGRVCDQWGYTVQFILHITSQGQFHFRIRDDCTGPRASKLVKHGIDCYLGNGVI